MKISRFTETLNPLFALQMYYVLLSIYFLNLLVSPEITTKPAPLDASLVDGALFSLIAPAGTFRFVIYMVLVGIGVFASVLAARSLKQIYRLLALVVFTAVYIRSPHDRSALILPALVLAFMSDSFISSHINDAYRCAMAAFYSQYVISAVWKLIGFFSYISSFKGPSPNIMRDLTHYIYLDNSPLSFLWATPLTGNTLFLLVILFQFSVAIGAFNLKANFWIGLSLIGFHILTQYVVDVTFHYNILFALFVLIIPFTQKVRRHEW